MPETYENYRDHSPIVRSGGSNAAGFPKVTTFENTFDAGRRELEAGDVAEVLALPPRTYVLGVLVQVLDGEGDAATINVGDGDDTDRYHGGVSVENDGSVFHDVTGHWYEDGDTLDIHMPAEQSIEGARIRIVASVVCYG